MPDEQQMVLGCSFAPTAGCPQRGSREPRYGNRAMEILLKRLGIAVQIRGAG